jgi:PKD repeat protein
VSTTPDLCRDTTYQVIRVHPYIHAEYALDEYLGCAPFTVDHQNASEGAISDYNWDWGDGSPPSSSSDTVISHTYQNTGLAESTHDLVLVVNNADGCTDTLQRSISVLPEVASQFTQNVTGSTTPLIRCG